MTFLYVAVVCVCAVVWRAENLAVCPFKNVSVCTFKTSRVCRHHTHILFETSSCTSFTKQVGFEVSKST